MEPRASITAFAAMGLIAVVVLSLLGGCGGSSPERHWVSCTARAVGKARADVPFFVNGMTCSDGKRVMLDALHDPEARTAPHHEFTIDGFACSESARLLSGVALLCKRNSEQVRFAVPS